MPKFVEKDLQGDIAKDLVDQVVSIRQRRRLIEERWLRSHRAWQALGIDRHFRSSDTSKNDYNIPTARRAIERSIIRAIGMLIPNAKWYEVLPAGTSDDTRLSNVDSYMDYILRKRIRSRSNISQLVRCMYLYGRCHLKTSVVVKNGNVWPSQRVVDPFSFYSFPETAAGHDEADVNFEDYLMSYEKYKSFADKGFVENISIDELTKPEWPYHMIERLSHQGITDPTQDISITREKIGETLHKATASYVSVTEAWWPKNDSLYQIYIVWNLRNGPRTTSFFKSEYDAPLYRTAIHRAVPNEMYTNSSMDDVVDLQDLSNDELNQFLDAADWEQGFVGVNDNEVGRMETIKAKGRSIWHFKDDPRQSVSMFQPNISSTNQLRAWQIVLGLINSLASTGTIAEGQPGRNMPRAGGAFNNLVSLALADVKDVSELVEEDVLSPSLGDIYKVSNQFIPDEQLVRVPGGMGLFNAVLRKKEIVGDYEFSWVGTQQFQEENLRAQRLMIFLDQLPRLEPMLRQQGYAFNLPGLIKMIWRYGLGERGLSKIIIPIQQQGGGLSGNTNGNVNGDVGTPGLKYRLPAVTNGFVEQAIRGR